jgi:hypothetical protein
MQVECLRKIQNQIDSNKNQMKSTVNIGNEMSDDEKVIFIKETISQGWDY